MKNRLSLLVLMLTFVCLAASGQKNNNTPQSVQTTISTLKDSIQQLEAKSQNLQTQIKNLENKVDTYQKLVSDTTSNMHDDLSDFYSKMIGVLSLIGLVLGVAAPLYFNYRNEKNMEKLLKEASDKADKAEKDLEDIQPKIIEATDQANAAINRSKSAEAQSRAASDITKKAEKVLSDLQPKVEKAEGVVATIEELRGNVVETTKKAKAIQYFIQALQENDPDRAIDYYTKCIDEDQDFAEAYNKRGYLRYRKGGMNDDAKKDFENAIAKKKNFAEAHNNLGVLLFSQKNFDDAEKNFNLAGEYAEAILNLGLLKNAKGDKDGAIIFFNKIIKLKPNLAEAYYIRGVFCLDYISPIGIEDIIKAKYYKPNVIEAYPNRNQLTGEMKEWDNSFYRVEYSRDFNTLIRVPEDKEGNFKIPSSVTVIGDWAFEGCTSLTSIEIPDSVTEIGKWAFKDCSSLTSIEIPDSVTEIGWGAFSGCDSLREIHLKHTSPVDFSRAFEELLDSKKHINISKITLYVPKDSVEAYKNQKFYGQFNVEPDKE